MEHQLGARQSSADRKINAAAALQFILSQRRAADYTNFNAENATMLFLFTLSDVDYS